jgi:hypothetical protein
MAPIRKFLFGLFLGLAISVGCGGSTQGLDERGHPQTLAGSRPDSNIVFVYDRTGQYASVVQNWVPAEQNQLDNEYRAAWGGSWVLTYADPPSGYFSVGIEQQAITVGDLGDHDANHGIVSAAVLASQTADPAARQIILEGALSHELLEMLTLREICDNCKIYGYHHGTKETDNPDVANFDLPNGQDYLGKGVIGAAGPPQPLPPRMNN